MNCGGEHGGHGAGRVRTRAHVERRCRDVRDGGGHGGSASAHHTRAKLRELGVPHIRRVTCVHTWW